MEFDFECGRVVEKLLGCGSEEKNPLGVELRKKEKSTPWKKDIHESKSHNSLIYECKVRIQSVGMEGVSKVSAS